MTEYLESHAEWCKPSELDDVLLRRNLKQLYETLFHAWALTSIALGLKYLHEHIFNVFCTQKS